MASKPSDLFKQESFGPFEAAKEGVQAIAPGLSFSKILHDVGQELKVQGAQGAHELVSALFRGDAFVMYPRTNQADGPEHGLPEQQQERSQGREM